MAMSAGLARNFSCGPWLRPNGAGLSSVVREIDEDAIFSPSPSSSFSISFPLALLILSRDSGRLAASLLIFVSAEMHCKTSCDSIGSSTFIFSTCLPAIADRRNEVKLLCLALPARLREIALQFVGKLDCFQPARQRKRSQTLFCYSTICFAVSSNFFPMKRNKFCDGRLCDAKKQQQANSTARPPVSAPRLRNLIFVELLRSRHGYQSQKARSAKLSGIFRAHLSRCPRLFGKI